MLVSIAAILHDPAGNEPPDSDERRAVFLHNNGNGRMCPVPPQGVLKGLNTSFAADPSETSQMTTEKKKCGFLRQIRSHLFCPSTMASFASLLGIRNRPTVPTPIPSSNGPYPASPVASSSQVSSGRHAQATVQHDHDITSTSSHKPSAKMSAHARPLSQRGHDDSRDYPPLLSEGNVFPLQHPDRKGKRLRKYPSHRTSRMLPNKFVSTDATALQSAPPHLALRKIWSAPPAINGSGLQRANLSAPSDSSGRRNTRTESMAVRRSGHQRVGTKSISGRSSATTKIPAERRGSQSRFPFALPGLLPRDFRYAARP